MEWLDAFLAHPVIDALGWTLIHFVWQGVLIGSAVYIVLSLLRNSKASTRYIVLCVGMIALLVAPIKTFVSIYGATETVQQNTIPLSTRDAIVDSGSDAPVVWSNSGNQIAELPSVDQSVEATGWISGTTMRWFGEGKITSVAVQVEKWMIRHLEWLVLAWVLGMFLMAMRLIGGYAYVQWIRHYKATPAAEHLQEMMLKLKKRLGINEPVELLNSVRVKVPMVIGWMKPAILIPTSMLTGLTTEQIESIIAHELAHIRRYDYLINIFQLIVETLLFYHPVVWWMSNEMRIEREHSCDDLAVSITGDAMTYARALTNLEELRMGHQSGAFAMAATDGSLMSRIRRIMGVNTGEANQSSNWLVGLLILAGLVGMGATYASDQLDNIKDRMASVDAENKALAEVTKAEIWSTEKSNPNPNPNYNYNYNYNSNGTEFESQFNFESLHNFEQLKALEALKAAKGIDHAEFWSKYGEEWGKKWGEAWSKAWTKENAEEINASVEAAMSQLEATFGSKDYYDEDGEYTMKELIEMKKYGVTREYIDNLKAAGYDHLSAEALIDFKRYGVTIPMIESLNNAGYKDIDPEDLVDIAKYDVTVSYIKQIMAAGFSDLSVGDLVDMSKYGVSPAMIQSLQNAGFTDLDPDDLVDMAKYGVSAEYIQAIREAGYTRVSTHELSDMKKYGVTPQLIQSLRKAGFTNLNPDDLADLAKYGVTADYINRIKATGFSNATMEDYVDMKKYGVDPSEIDELMKAGGSDLTAEDIVDMGKYGVTAQYIRAIKDAGIDISDMEGVIDMRKYGVDTSYIQNMRKALGSKVSVDPDEWSDMYKFGVKPSLVESVRAYGLRDWTLEDLTDMAKYGVSKKFLDELAENEIKNLSTEDIIDLKKYNVDMDYIKSMQKQ